MGVIGRQSQASATWRGCQNRQNWKLNWGASGVACGPSAGKQRIPGRKKAKRKGDSLKENFLWEEGPCHLVRAGRRQFDLEETCIHLQTDRNR
jgi:hypothetical protein